MNVKDSQGNSNPPYVLNLSSLFLTTLGELVSESADMPQAFANRFGVDFYLSFLIDTAKRKSVGLRGPSVTRKHKAVEFGLIIPFEDVRQDYSTLASVTHAVLLGTTRALEQLRFDVSRIQSKQKSMVATVCSSPGMIDDTMEFD